MANSSKQGTALAMTIIVGFGTIVLCKSYSERERKKRETEEFLNRSEEEIATEAMDDAYLDHILTRGGLNSHPLVDTIPQLFEVREEYEREYAAASR